MSSHPVEPGQADTRQVFEALLATLPEHERPEWVDRFAAARRVERRRRDYDQQWTESLRTVQYGGQ